GLDAVWGYTPGIENMRRLIELFAHDRTLASDDLIDLRYRASIRAGVQESFSRMFPAPRQRGVDDLASFESRLGEVRAPTLLVHGRDDRVIPLDTSLTLLRALSDVQLHVFGACGHWSQIEGATDFGRIVGDFLTVRR